MQSNRLRAADAAAGPPERRAADLRLHLERLIDELDESSLRATLKLMLAEARGAIRKKQSLIALERLDGRDTADRVTRLRELESMQDELMAAYARHVPSEDDFMVDGNEPAAALQGEPARPQPPTIRARQGRHAFRPAG
jgi:hypothetical protein